MKIPSTMMLNTSEIIKRFVKKKLAEINFDLIVLPPHTTAHQQTLDIAVKRSFKFNYKLLYNLWFDKQKEDDNSKPSKDRILQWVSQSWLNVIESSVING
jgi:coproporphyrinogen III oxidase-like Fe-S oxidoreductase